ncbi:MAG: lasso peptide biosynthesis B2 protein [Alphaproteobacteria bacterium]|nr:lasso peptide biosynthesis B2 protein [Alphaproteobacteria bacterium]
MYYHLADHIYITQFKKEYILLNAKLDKYVVCSSKISNIFEEIFSRENLYFSQHNSSTSQDLKFNHIQKLLNKNIIEYNNQPYPYYIDRKINSNGVTNVDWKLPLKNKNNKINLQVILALKNLIKIHMHMKIKGFYATIKLLKKFHKLQVNYIIPQREELDNLANIVNDACMIYPTRTKCLEWAMTFVLMALKRNWKCNLEIGLQNYPFMAHAWVECDGKVVRDSPNLREEMAIILNEPFRRAII